jgi:PIN domain nuclease of toxin-antitoxin system
VTRFLGRAGIEPVPLGHRTACRGYQLHRLEHRDPADRLLIATAIELACPWSLTTAPGGLPTGNGRQYGFAASA